jgi:hypothetical protein
VKTARELGCDESEEAFERAFKKIVPPKNLAGQMSRELCFGDEQTSAQIH